MYSIKIKRAAGRLIASVRRQASATETQNLQDAAMGAGGRAISSADAAKPEKRNAFIIYRPRQARIRRKEKLLVVKYT